ncbi:hypothetical protein C6495_08375 [Candidatus Poribacteria bacterium]|nr:MAG: hypothetical protein C6495_08375 [Candidatus Poribacteria bacterium]
MIFRRNDTFLLGHPFNIRLSRDDIQTMLLAFNMLDVFFTQKVPKIQQKNRFSGKVAAGAQIIRSGDARFETARPCALAKRAYRLFVIAGVSTEKRKIAMLMTRRKKCVRMGQNAKRRTDTC